jgi:DNA-binding transcriptional ArsR family regulator
MARTRQRRIGTKRDVFAALGDPTRRCVLDLLSRGPLPVKRIADPFAMTRPAVSQHLRILKEAGLVEAQRVGRERQYHLRAARLREVFEWVRHYQKFWPSKLEALGKFLNREGTE